MRHGVGTWALLAALTCAAWPAAAQPGDVAIEQEPERLSDEGELNRAMGLFDAGRYDECAERLGSLLDAKNPEKLVTPSVVERARVYAAACFIGSGEAEQADEMFRAALRANSQMRAPDSLVFPGPVVDRFLTVREEMKEEIRKAEQARIQQARQAAAKAQAQDRAEERRQAELERLASEQTVTVLNRRWISFVPFGVGQFQNGDDALGWVFLLSETALGVTALTSLIVPLYYDADYWSRRAAGERPDTQQLNSLKADWYTVGTFAGPGLLLVAAVGIAEAQLSYEPVASRRTVERPLPARLRSRPEAGGVELSPSAALYEGGLGFGLSGRF